MSRTVIVTGGASGLGSHITKGFANHGDRVIILGRNIITYNHFIDSNRPIADKVVFLKADISSYKDVNYAFDKIIADYGNIDILVNNAGLLGPVGRFDQCDLHDWIHNLNVNLVGTALATYEAIKYMLPKKQGKIINIAGGGAVRPLPSLSAYSASKAGLVRLTETLAIEFEPFNIQINAIAPGFISTGIHNQIINSPKHVDKQLVIETLEKTSSGGDNPALTAALCLFLAEGSNKITGKLLSAIYDDWKNLTADSINRVSLYTLRRVDNYKVYENKPK